jgi:hypothetical protein
MKKTGSFWVRTRVLAVSLFAGIISLQGVLGQVLINIDIGAGTSTSEVGPAAIGHNPNDLWNFYTRDDGSGGWLTFGALGNLQTAEGSATFSGMTIANAPGAWGNGSSDSMYNGYDYPFDGGNVTVVVTNLDSGAYDFYVYGIDSTYEVTVAGQSYGIKTLGSGPVINPVVWQEGNQYVVFRSVPVTSGLDLTLTVRPGIGGYATISGIQIASGVPTNYPPVAKAQSVNLIQDSSKAITLTATDLNGDALTYAVVDNPTNGTLSGSAPNLTYTPSPGYAGPDSFTFKANDGQVDSALATVSINVIAAGTGTLINVDIGAGSTTSEVGPAATGHTSSDFWNFYTRDDGSGGWRSFGVLSNLKTAEGLATGAGMTIANAPGAWGNGSADFMYNGYDYPFDGGNVTVALTNLDAGYYDIYVYGIDSTYEVTVPGRSYGLKAVSSGPVVNPVVWQEGNQYVVFRSVHVINSQDVTLTVRPGAGGYATISGFQVASGVPTNHPPVANNQTASLLEGSSKAITLTASDLDGDSLTYSVVSNPTNGTLGGTAPNLTYTPTAGYSGPDSFTFKANDGQLDSAVATVSINVIPAGTGTLINVDIGAGSATSEVGSAATGHGPADFWNFYTRDDGSGGWRTFGVLSNLKTAEGLATAAGMTIANAPGAWGNGSSDSMYDGYDYPFDGGNVTIGLTNLDAGFYDLYVYGIDSSYEATVGGQSYGIKPVSSGPVVNPVVWQEGNQYVVFRSVHVNGGDAITLTVRPGSGGYATISGLQIASGALTNHPPVANNQDLNLLAGSSTPITLTGSDLDGDALTYWIVSGPTNGTLSGTAPNLTYTPAGGFVGTDSFSFKVNDGQVDSAVATVVIHEVAAGSGLLIDIDIGAGNATSEVGPAATGHNTNDLWNFYTRDDGSSGWRSFGVLSNLKTTEGFATGAGMTISNAPGAWGNGSADPMYNGYDYPFDGGNVTVGLTNLDGGAYDIYVYGIDSSYELSVNGLSVGSKSLGADPVVNPVVWQEGVQYVLFTNVITDPSQAIVLTVRPGSGGYATIAGLQIASHSGNSPAPPSPSSGLAVPAVYAPFALTRPATGVTSSGAVLNAVVNPQGAPTTAWFEWGTSPALGNSTPVTKVGDFSSNITFSATLTGLQPGTAYYYRVSAANMLGASSTDIKSFAWSPAPPSIDPAAVLDSGVLRWHFSGASGQSYQVQASTDLSQWQPAGSAKEIHTGVFEFSDPDASQYSRRYYRIVSP